MKRTVVLTAGMLALGMAGWVGSRLAAQQAGSGAPAPQTVSEPRTRIALLNLAYVIKNYRKWESFQAEIKGNVKEFEGRVQLKQKAMEELAKHAGDPKTTQEQRDNDQHEITKLKREIEDVNNEGKTYLVKKSDDQMVIIYREVQDAATRYAVAHNFELVLHYSDATTQADYYGAANILGKLQARACMPLYATPGLDISREVVTALNAHYGATPNAGTSSNPRPPSGN